MKTYHKKFEQYLPIPLAEAWNFFSSPFNLAKITPPQMKFIVTSDYDANTKMYPGMIITYKITPLLGIKMNWMTEITHVKENEYFVDEQRFGPYALWHHQHHFKEVKGGVLMTDILHYAIPYGFLGRFANDILVKKQIKNIFAYRKQEIIKLFGPFKVRE
ncbi:Ligand-binding SRPBCC domain-containing protein [Mucilaginibacter mallensis]|uniref:Ligand-binding SRPBCC domain-containing protein n=1 Tax=Mucilaginibacter mallensis TaxID=652787 RepID=A0A1H2AYD1_MUCMA|nr:SRPBCC family protein [Mucilaginibacter mallensis]SDT50556.1 Ligand-binding SRPBCC domain-containing protein [Mucilaginibacter mallensis]